MQLTVERLRNAMLRRIENVLIRDLQNNDYPNLPCGMECKWVGQVVTCCRMPWK